MKAEREEELIASEIMRSHRMPLSASEIQETSVYVVDWLAYKNLIKSVIRLENRRNTLEREIKTLTEAKRIIFP